MADALYRRKDSPEAAFDALMKSPKQIAMFNKESGAFTGLTAMSSKGHINEEFYKWKEIKIDTETQKWDGDYDTGKVVNLDEVPVEILERDMDRRAGETIEYGYPWYKQVNAIIPVMLALIEKNNLTGPEVDAFLDLAEFVEDKRALNDRYKKAYSEGPDWKLISKEEEYETRSKKLAGGLLEKIGPTRGITDFGPSTPGAEITGPGQ
jgi:hypothetical protein